MTFSRNTNKAKIATFLGALMLSAGASAATGPCPEAKSGPNSTLDAAGRVIASTDANGGTIVFVYDDKNRLIACTNAQGVTTRLQYDAAGKQIAVSN